MKWQRLDRSSPLDGTMCVVGHFVKGQRKPIMGLWRYCYFGDDSYWQTKNGERVKCGKYDNWCDVEDIIDAVGERVENEFRPALNDMYLRDTF